MKTEKEIKEEINRLELECKKLAYDKVAFIVVFIWKVALTWVLMKDKKVKVRKVKVRKVK